MQAGAVGQGFLRDPSGLPVLPDDSTESPREGRRGHIPDRSSAETERLQTIVTSADRPSVAEPHAVALEGLRVFRAIGVVALVVGLGACATPPPDWRAVDDQYVCATVGNWRHDPQQHSLGVRELVRRGRVRPQYVNDLSRHRIVMGMSSCELVASWGWPNEQNRSVGSWGNHTQWVYGDFATSQKPRFVYTENDFVTSWQD